MSIQWYPGHMRRASNEMIEALPLVNVVIEVLDARIPFSSSNPFIQELSSDKPHIKLIVSSVYASETSLFDPICDSLEIVSSPESVLHHGCPVQYFDELEISDDVSDEERQKIERMLASVTPELE